MSSCRITIEPTNRFKPTMYNKQILPNCTDYGASRQLDPVMVCIPDSYKF